MTEKLINKKLLLGELLVFFVDSPKAFDICHYGHS